MAKKFIPIIIFVLCVVFLAQNLSQHGIEYRDDEIFYFNATKTMVESGDYLSPTYFGKDRFQKPILFYWTVLVNFFLFGINWFAARMPAVIFASLSIMLTWVLARDFFNEKVAAISSFILISIPLFFRHAKNAVPDMPLNFFIILAIYCFFKFLHEPERWTWKLGFFIACALGFMMKGPAAIIIPFLTAIVYALCLRQPKSLLRLNIPVGLILMGLIIVPWFMYMINVHGAEYFDHVAGREVQQRVIGDGSGNIVLGALSAFKNNSLFYLETMMSYFAPWSGFAFLAIPFGIWAMRKREEDRQGLLAMSVWFFVVFIFFSLMHERINHYILVLSTPFAVLTAYFFLEPFESKNIGVRFMAFYRRYMSLFIIVSGLFALAFLRVFLVGGHKAWLIVFVAALIGALVTVFKNRNVMALPLTIGIFFVFVYAQTGLVYEAGLIPHATLQRTANYLNPLLEKQDTIGVGSHDIHEKEWQVYFDRKIEKAATSEDEETYVKLHKLFANPSPVYCLMIEEDYERILNNELKNDLQIIYEDDMFRRRLNIDEGFFKALSQLDADTVRDYFFEKVILVKK